MCVCFFLFFSSLPLRSSGKVVGSGRVRSGSQTRVVLGDLGRQKKPTVFVWKLTPKKGWPFMFPPWPSSQGANRRCQRMDANRGF